ncbi:secretion protein HlyD [Gloeomargarita lithophora Alchichica-D10]|uniref:Secretion protein HlyD n=1 Tax=Gloeomargarita lithophora Alchichica-D10 TaxID=1188229 RepID=A0A1J0ABB9_9CYAN|nr:ABC exporter membrane fusion protein [Gloeomargarita lithophora]APB33193.1 secretion protein HlyD [Gloeomargarita lithophora Alchichica-D10]
MLGKFQREIAAGKLKIKWHWLALGVVAPGLLLVAVRLGLDYWAQSQAPAPTPPVVKVKPMIAALGRIQPEGEIITLSAPSSIEGARVSEILVQEGEVVRQGQVLANLDTTSKRRVEVQLAANEVAIAQAQLNQVLAGAKTGDIQARQAQVGRLEAELRLAQTDLQRNQGLYQEGGISAAALDNFRLRVDTVRQQLQEAQANLRSVREVRGVDVKLAQAQVAQARNRLALAQVELDLSLIKAPVAGRVLKIHTRVGETVGNEGILDLGRTARMFVVAEVYETDILGVQAGQRAVITGTALPAGVRGTVTQVGWQVAKKDVLDTDPVADVDARVVEVKIALDQAASAQVNRLTNMVVNVQIER